LVYCYFYFLDDLASKTLQHMRSQVGGMVEALKLTSISQNNDLEASFSSVPLLYPSLFSEVESIFMQFTDRVKRLVDGDGGGI
jgi:hypothetical protein